MDEKILGEIQKHFKQEVIEFDWEPIRRQPKRFAILYPIIGYLVSLLSVIFMGLGIFMWLFLIAGSILFFGGIYCANGIIGEFKKLKIEKRKKMAVIVDLEKCTGCGTCEEGCPVEAIKVENGKAVVDQEACVDCGTCIEECPEKAIREWA